MVTIIGVLVCLFVFCFWIYNIGLINQNLIQLDVDLKKSRSFFYQALIYLFILVLATVAIEIWIMFKYQPREMYSDTVLNLMLCLPRLLQSIFYFYIGVKIPAIWRKHALNLKTSNLIRKYSVSVIFLYMLTLIFSGSVSSKAIENILRGSGLSIASNIIAIAYLVAYLIILLLFLYVVFLSYTLSKRGNAANEKQAGEILPYSYLVLKYLIPVGIVVMLIFLGVSVFDFNQCSAFFVLAQKGSNNTIFAISLGCLFLYLERYDMQNYIALIYITILSLFSVAYVYAISPGSYSEVGQFIYFSVWPVIGLAVALIPVLLLSFKRKNMLLLGALSALVLYISVFLGIVFFTNYSSNSTLIQLYYESYFGVSLFLLIILAILSKKFVALVEQKKLNYTIQNVALTILYFIPIINVILLITYLFSEKSDNKVNKLAVIFTSIFVLIIYILIGTNFYKSTVMTQNNTLTAIHGCQVTTLLQFNP